MTATLLWTTHTDTVTTRPDVYGICAVRTVTMLENHHHLRSLAPVRIVDHVAYLSKDFAQLLQRQDHSDITFVVGATSFPSHKVILAARSEYFRALLYGGMKESQPGTTEIELKDTPPVAFSAFLKYIYSGCMNLTEMQEENLLDILSLSHRFGFAELQSSVSDYLKAIICIHNVSLIFDLANMYNLSSLCNVCKDYIDAHTQEILKQDNFLFLSRISARDMISRDSFCAPEIDIFKAVNKWAVYNKDQDPVPILKAVRFQLMEPRDLMHVRDSGLMSSDAILDAIENETKSGSVPLNYRGFKVLDNNIALESLGASVIRGEKKANLLDGDTQNYGAHRGFLRHSLDDNNDRGIVIKLGKRYYINTIQLQLWDKDMRSYSYYIEVSAKDRDYERVIDHTQYLCRSWQKLHFPARVVRYIRIVGTHNTVNRTFHLVSFGCYYTSLPFHLEQGLIVPTENVATVQDSACVIEGVSAVQNALINGDTRDCILNYTGHKLGSGGICIQLAQPYMLSTMRLLLWDGDNRNYSFYIIVSTDKQKWTRVVDKQNELCKSWQTFAFDQIPVTFIRIVGTRSKANEAFLCVHFESPADAIVGSAT